MSLRLREHKLCLFGTGVGRAGELRGGSVAPTEGGGGAPQSPGQPYRDMGSGVRKTQAHILHFLFTGSVALSSSCGVTALQLSDL